MLSYCIIISDPSIFPSQFHLPECDHWFSNQEFYSECNNISYIIYLMVYLPCFYNYMFLQTLCPNRCLNYKIIRASKNDGWGKGKQISIIIDNVFSPWWSKTAEVYLGKMAPMAVINVPNYFSDAQRQSSMNVLQLLDCRWWWLMESIAI